MERSSGILLPVFSLPGAGGIGTLGSAAHAFVDFLALAGQRYWQMLPLGPTSYGDSPYQSFSTYAGNPYFVDPELLLEEGLLTAEEISAFAGQGDPLRVDYPSLYRLRLPLLRLAFLRGRARDALAIARFEQENAAWLFDYALFMALKEHFGMRAWVDWEDADIRLRTPDALAHYAELLREETAFHRFVQYHFFKQWDALRAHAREAGLCLLGDLPIYVALDSADVWAHPDMFLLDEARRPIAVAGVPPDYFSETGQLWGNPLYRWEAMAADGFSWWRARVQGAARLYDALRIDHFRGFADYWRVDAAAETAVHGSWEKGPGLALVNALKEAAPEVMLIAEDLGDLSGEARALLAASGLPGMNVLEFAFDPAGGGSCYLPHAHVPNSVCYIGTHDNAPVIAWRAEAAPGEVERASEYLALTESEGFHIGMLRGGMASVCSLFIAQMQDWLALGAESRTNTPGTLGGNWAWRLAPGCCTPQLASRIRRMSALYGRCAP